MVMTVTGSMGSAAATSLYRQKQLNDKVDTVKEIHASTKDQTEAY
jgi:hypothetical protein